MAIRKALVLDDDLRVREIGNGDTLEITGSVSTVLSAENTQGTTITRLDVVYTKSDGSVALARANASATTEVTGLVRDTSIADQAVGFIQTNGIIEAETTDWDAITGQTSGLTPGSYYVLDPDVAGQMLPRSSASVSAGEFVSVVGKAVSATEFKIEPLPAIGR